MVTIAQYLPKPSNCIDIFSGSVVEMILQGPLELLIGITWGVLMGVISIYIPHSDEVQLSYEPCVYLMQPTKYTVD